MSQCPGDANAPREDGYARDVNIEIVRAQLSRILTRRESDCRSCVLLDDASYGQNERNRTLVIVDSGLALGNVGATDTLRRHSR